MKKTFLASLAALILLCCFAGCGNETSTLQGTFWIPVTYENCTTWQDYMTATSNEGRDLGIYFTQNKTGYIADYDMRKYPYYEPEPNTAYLKDWQSGTKKTFKFENGVLTLIDTEEVRGKFTKAPFIPEE